MGHDLPSVSGTDFGCRFRLLPPTSSLFGTRRPHVPLNTAAPTSVSSLWYRSRCIAVLPLDMSLTSHSLPLPAIFTHDETLHAILLPPLAIFLSSLSEPPHLLKLNDILDRFRTPKSYHRVDVRLVESSELPPASEDGRGGGAGEEPEGDGSQRLPNNLGDPSTEGKKKEDQEWLESLRARQTAEKGEPIILEKGVTMEEYLSRERPTGPTEDLDKAGETGPSSPASQSLNFAIAKDAHDGIAAGPTTPPVHPPLTPSSPARVPLADPTQIANGNSDVQDLSNTRPSETRPTATHAAPPSPVPSHPLPPSGPKRRVRELRLDLRTLDAAALFALETWRREMMGLQKLELDHPDSIWYKGSLPPSPSPSDSPEPVPPPRGRGRPPKSRDIHKKEIVIGGGECGGEGYETLMETVEQHGVSEGKAVSVELDSTVLEALKEVVDTRVNVIDVAPYESPVFSHSEGEDELDEVDELEDSDRKISPDVIVDDMFDRNQDQDPDFQPPPESNRGEKSTRHAQSERSPDKGKGLAILPLSNSLHRVDNGELIDLTADSPISTPRARQIATSTMSSIIRMNDPNQQQRESSDMANYDTPKHTSSSLDAPRQYAKRTAGPISPEHLSKARGKGLRTGRMRMEAVVVPQRRRVDPRKLVHFMESTTTIDAVDVENQLLLPPFQRESRKIIKPMLNRNKLQPLPKVATSSATLLGNGPRKVKVKAREVAIESDDEPLVPKTGVKRKIEQVLSDSDDEPLLPPLKRSSTKVKVPEVIEILSEEEAEEVEEAEEAVEEKSAPAFVPAKPREPDEEWDFLRDM